MRYGVKVAFHLQSEIQILANRRLPGKRTFFMTALATSDGALVDCKAPNAFKQDYHALNSPRVGTQLPQT
jgi:hypothetical protein